MILPSILFTIAPPRGSMPFSNEDHYSTKALEGENAGYLLEKVNDDYLSETELRVYYEDDCVIKEIAPNAFDNCDQLETVMLSRYIEKVPSNIFDNVSTLTTINYTGSEEQFKSLDLDVSNIDVNYYANDEGFLCYWFDNIRPTEKSNICDISDETYHEMLTLYGELSDDERQIVNVYEDAGDRIINSITYLKSVKTKTVVQENTPDVEKSTMIAFILIIASVGMTFICIFYLLKERKVIN